MGELPDNENDERAVANVIHSVYLKLFVAGFVVGSLLLVGGAIASAHDSLHPTVRNIGSWVRRGGLLIAAVSFPLSLISWFERETTKHPGFREQRLPRRYRTIAWSLLLLTVVLFVASLWFTLSRGLTTWR